MDVNNVVVCDDSLRVDDVVIRARPEAAVDPVHPTRVGQKVLSLTTFH